jgi:hypothetical protein
VLCRAIPSGSSAPSLLVHRHDDAWSLSFLGRRSKFSVMIGWGQGRVGRASFRDVCHWFVVKTVQIGFRYGTRWNQISPKLQVRTYSHNVATKREYMGISNEFSIDRIHNKRKMHCQVISRRTMDSKFALVCLILLSTNLLVYQNPRI